MKLVLAPLCLCLLAAPGAAAQSEPASLQEIEQALKSRAEEERRLRKEAEARAEEAAALRHRLIEAADSIQRAEQNILALEESIRELETEQTAAEGALKRESDNLSDVLAALQSLERSRPPALLVSPEDANKAARAAMLLSEAAPEIEGRAARLRSAIDRLATLTEALEEERTDYETANQELAARRDVLAELMATKEKERDVAARLAAAAQKETARLAVQATNLRELVQRLERLAHMITPRVKPARKRLAAPASRGVTAPSIKRAAPKPFVAKRAFNRAQGALRAPVTGRLAGRYGAKRPEGGTFEGLRFETRNQAIVTAPFEGRVVVARDWQPVGNLLILDVGGGYHILLLGVDDILVQEDQRISAGEPVAKMAQSASFLDLEIRKNGEPVNPLLWLSAQTKNELAL